jgi:hypothetical protein
VVVALSFQEDRVVLGVQEVQVAQDLSFLVGLVVLEDLVGLEDLEEEGLAFLVVLEVPGVREEQVLSFQEGQEDRVGQEDQVDKEAQELLIQEEVVPYYQEDQGLTLHLVEEVLQSLVVEASHFQVAEEEEVNLLEEAEALRRQEGEVL